MAKRVGSDTIFRNATRQMKKRALAYQSPAVTGPSVYHVPHSPFTRRGQSETLVEANTRKHGYRDGWIENDRSLLGGLNILGLWRIRHLVFSPLCSSITLAKSSLLILCGFKGERKWLRIEEFVFPEKFRGKSKGFERRFRETELWRKVQVFSGVFKEIVCLCTIYLLIRFFD